MKRPSPLPQPPESVRPTPRVERTAGRDADETAPVTPLARPAATPVALPPSLARPGATGAAESPSPEGAGLRDLWRASQARRRVMKAEVRRFTVRSRRRRNIWIGVGAAVLLTVAGTAGAAYSPLFAVERIDVVGTSQLDATAVADALGGQLGTPLALVDDSAVKAALVTFPLVESYTLEARPPHDLVVNIVERTPIGAMKTAAGFTVVDAAGVALSTTPDAPTGQPVLDIAEGTGSAAFHAAGRVVRALPEAVRSQVTGVTASTPDDVTLTLGASGSTVVWGSADRSAEKAVVLDRLMQKSPPDRAKEYDVTSPEAGVVRG